MKVDAKFPATAGTEGSKGVKKTEDAERNKSEKENGKAGSEVEDQIRYQKRLRERVEGLVDDVSSHEVLVAQ